MEPGLLSNWWSLTSPWRKDRVGGGGPFWYLSSSVTSPLSMSIPVAPAPGNPEGHTEVVGHEVRFTEDRMQGDAPVWIVHDIAFGQVCHPPVLVVSKS